MKTILAVGPVRHPFGVDAVAHSLLPIPVLANLTRRLLLEPWESKVSYVTHAQLLTCLKAAELCIARLSADLQAALDAAAPVQSQTAWANTVGAITTLLGQLRGTCEHQPGWDSEDSQLGSSDSPLALALTATQLATQLVQHWAPLLATLASSAGELLQELLYTVGSALRWASAGSHQILQPTVERTLLGLQLAVDVSQLAQAVAKLPPCQQLELAAVLGCEVRSELLLVLANSVWVASNGLSSYGIRNEREGAIYTCLFSQLGTTLGACSRASQALVSMKLPYQQRSAAHCVAAISWMLTLSGSQQAQVPTFRRCLMAAGLEALVFRPATAEEFSLAGHAFQSLLEAARHDQEFACALATGYLEKLLGWASLVVRNIKKQTSKHMILALRPARDLVVELASAVLRSKAAHRGSASSTSKGLAEFRKLGDKCLRGRFMWENVALQKLLPSLCS